MSFSVDIRDEIRYNINRKRARPQAVMPKVLGLKR